MIPGREETGRRRAKRHRGRGRPCLDSRYREPFLDSMGESPRDPGAGCVGWHRPALRGGLRDGLYGQAGVALAFEMGEVPRPCVQSQGDIAERSRMPPSRVADRLQSTRFGRIDRSNLGSIDFGVVGPERASSRSTADSRRAGRPGRPGSGHENGLSPWSRRGGRRGQELSAVSSRAGRRPHFKISP